jgi:hypothetical protein
MLVNYLWSKVFIDLGSPLVPQYLVNQTNWVKKVGNSKKSSFKNIGMVNPYLFASRKLYHINIYSIYIIDKILALV